MKLIPADQFTIEQLTEAYNQTRVDYIVPMPMNAARLQEYIDVYDVELAASWVAVNEQDEPLGLGMLTRGRMELTPHRIEGLEELQTILRRAKELEDGSAHKDGSAQKEER